MAVIAWEHVTTPVTGQGLKLVRWAGLGASDTGQPFVVAQYSDKTVQWVSTGGSGITIQGSLDSSVDSAGNPNTTDWETLNDPQGNAMSAVTADKIENILEHCYQIRPSCGAGVSGATVWLLLASTR